MGSANVNPKHVARQLLKATDSAFQMEIDLTVLVAEFRREDDQMDVTAEEFAVQIDQYNAQLKKHCDKFFSYLFVRLPGFDRKKKQLIPVKSYSETGFVPGPAFESAGFKKLLKSFRFMLLGLPNHLKENMSWTNAFAEATKNYPAMSLGQAHFMHSCLTPPRSQEEEVSD